MKKRMAAMLLVSALALSAGMMITGCAEKEPEHTTHYDVNADGKCDVCAVDMEGHKHIFSKKWEVEGEYHWHKATCAHSDEKDSYEKHTFGSDGRCTVCKTFSSDPVKPVDGVYHLQAEFAILDDGETASGSTMVVEVDRHEFTESGKTDGVAVTDIGYFGGNNSKGQTITWKVTAEAACEVTLTLRIASAVGSWSDLKISEIDLADESAPVLSVNDTKIDLSGKKIEGLDNLTMADMQSGVAYSHFTEIEVKVNLKVGENNIVLAANGAGCNVDKIMIKTTANLSFVNTDNTSRISS